MFGLWRFSLAIEVVAYHLLHVPLIGQFAVFGFFVLSGFLMTAILRGTYGYTPRGVIRYAENRLLRLLPNYWFALATSLFVIAWLGAGPIAAYNPAMTVPASARHWAENLTMVFAGFDPHDRLPRLVPPSWALTVELCFYLVIGLGASRSGRAIALWIMLSLFYLVLVALSGRHGGYYYFAIPAGSLPFAIGAATFHLRLPLHALIRRARFADPRLLIAARWALFLLVVVLQRVTGRGGLATIGNVINIALASLIVCSLYFTTADRRWRRLDRVAGDYSYPIYLLHWQMGAVAAHLLSGRVLLASGRAAAVPFAGALVLTIGAGSVCVWLIDPLVGRLRARVRARAIRDDRHADRPRDQKS